jgi:hypothetical protein
LSTLCREFPNHLFGNTLRRLIEAGWKPNQIYCAMDPAAQKRLANEKPWEVLQTRWQEEKRRMALRKESTSNAIHLAQVTRKTRTVNDQMVFEDQTSRLKPSPNCGDVAQEGENKGENDDGGDSDDSDDDEEETIQPETNLSVWELDNLIRHEILKQQELICGPIGMLSPSESNQRMLDVWIPRANQWTTSFMAGARIREEDIPPAQNTSLFEATNRQNSILKNVVHGLHRIPKNTDAKGLYSHLETVARNVLYFQVQILQVWTKEWEQNLSTDGGRREVDEDARGRARRGSETPDSDQDKPQVSSQPHNRNSLRLFRNEQTSTQTPEDVLANKHAMSRGQMHQPARSTTPQDQVHQAHQNLRKQTEPVLNGSLQAGDSGSRPQHSPYPRHAPLQCHQPTPQVDRIQGGRIPPTSDGTNVVSNVAAVPGSIHTNSNLTASMLAGVRTTQPVNFGHLDMSTGYHQQPSNLQSVANLGSRQPAAQNGQTQPTTNRRGAPRRRMFIEAAPRDRPLPQLALDDDDVILNHFPEHLSHSVIMRRFVASSPSRPGGHPTGEMVKALLQHTINGDQEGLTDHQRKAKIRRWVVKEKDSCNKKLKEGRVPSSVPPYMIASSAAIQPVLQAPSGVVASSTVLQPSLQSLASMVAMSATTQTGLQASQVVPAPVSNPALAHPIAVASFTHPATVASFNTAAANFDASGTRNAAPLGPYATPFLPSTADRISQYQVDSRYTSPAIEQQISSHWLDMRAVAASTRRYAMIGNTEARQYTNVYSQGDWSLGAQSQESDSTYLSDLGILQSDEDMW